MNAVIELIPFVIINAQGYFANTTDNNLMVFRSKLGHEPFHFSFVQQTILEQFVI